MQRNGIDAADENHSEKHWVFSMRRQSAVSANVGVPDGQPT